MGQKIHPLGLRLGITQDHYSLWITRNKETRWRWLIQDKAIRDYLNANFKRGRIKKIVIRRDQEQVEEKTGRPVHIIRPYIYAARPYSVCRNKRGLPQFAKNLRKVCQNAKLPLIGAWANKPHFLILPAIYRVNQPSHHAYTIAENIIEKLEDRKPFRSALRGAILKLYEIDPPLRRPRPKKFKSKFKPKFKPKFKQKRFITNKKTNVNQFQPKVYEKEVGLSFNLNSNGFNKKPSDLKAIINKKDPNNQKQLNQDQSSMTTQYSKRQPNQRFNQLANVKFNQVSDRDQNQYQIPCFQFDSTKNVSNAQDSLNEFKKLKYNRLRTLKSNSINPKNAFQNRNEKSKPTDSEAKNDLLRRSNGSMEINTKHIKSPEILDKSFDQNQKEPLSKESKMVNETLMKSSKQFIILNDKKYVLLVSKTGKKFLKPVSKKSLSNPESSVTTKTDSKLTLKRKVKGKINLKLKKKWITFGSKLKKNSVKVKQKTQLKDTTKQAQRKKKMESTRSSGSPIEGKKKGSSVSTMSGKQKKAVEIKKKGVGLKANRNISLTKKKKNQLASKKMTRSASNTKDSASNTKVKARSKMSKKGKLIWLKGKPLKRKFLKRIRTRKIDLKEMTPLLPEKRRKLSDLKGNKTVNFNSSKNSKKTLKKRKSLRKRKTLGSKLDVKARVKSATKFKDPIAVSENGNRISKPLVKFTTLREWNEYHGLPAKTERYKQNRMVYLLRKRKRIARSRRSKKILRRFKAIGKEKRASIKLGITKYQPRNRVQRNKNRKRKRRRKKPDEDKNKLTILEGVRIQLSGRLNGADIARVESYKQGRVPLQTLRGPIDYVSKAAKTRYGMLGIKVWAFDGEVGV